MTLLRRHGRWLIVAALAGIVGALLFYAARPTTYVSTAQVDVESEYLHYRGSAGRAEHGDGGPSGYLWGCSGYYRQRVP